MICSVFLILTASKNNINYQNNKVFLLVLLVVEMFRNIDFQMRYDQFPGKLFVYFFLIIYIYTYLFNWEVTNVRHLPWSFMVKYCCYKIRAMHVVLKQTIVIYKIKDIPQINTISMMRCILYVIFQYKNKCIQYVHKRDYLVGLSV